MPVGEDFWNPYRWVTLSNRSVEHDVPHYHHTFSDLSGRLWCELEALTPLLIGDGQTSIQFVRHKHNWQPYIPSTSLKGAIRALVEVVGNGTVPFSTSVERRHQPAAAARQDRKGVSQLDTVTGTFGYLHQGDSNVFAGLIHFSDAEISTRIRSMNTWPPYNVAVGQPKPTHRAFYPGNEKRKFYHHHPGAEQLVAPHPGITQTTAVRPAPPGTSFHFTVDFTNLRNDELNLLLYCLTLEEQVTVTLSPAALGEDEGTVELVGPLRHKIGYAKPHGAGSVHIRITKMQLCEDATARYQGKQDTVDVFTGETLTDEISTRTASSRSRADRTMEELRAMMIYTINDPRNPVHYPTYQWFENEKEQGLRTELKPTL